ncbi:MAG: hypothetical protein QRY72_04730 [Candidatus Rhabdochlamydia sp.]
MNDQKKEDVVSMKEVEQFVKKYWIQLFFSFLFFFTFLFSVAGAFRPALSLFFLAIGGITSLLIPDLIDRGVKGMLMLILKQERVIQVILAGVLLIIACTLPFLVVMVVGLLSALLIHQRVKETPFNPLD